MTKSMLPAAGLLLLALPAFAQTKPLTPPDVLRAAKTIQFTATLVSDGKALVISKAILVQPNKAFIVDTNAKTNAVEAVYASDGKMQTEYLAYRGTCVKDNAPTRLLEINTETSALPEITPFLVPGGMSGLWVLQPHSPSDPADSSKYSLSLGEHQIVLVVNNATGLPISTSTFDVKQTPVKLDNVTNFTDWKLNAPVDNSKFAYAPPANTKMYVTPLLLVSGTAAPDFTVQDKDGKAVKLSDYKGKTVVLDFWATWCGPCQLSLPHTTEMTKKYADKNVVVLAVNVWDTKPAFDGWLPKHPEYAPLHFAIDPNPDHSKSAASALYGVSGIPTQYVIGSDGKIVKSIVGYDPEDTQLEDTLKTATVGTGN